MLRRGERRRAASLPACFSNGGFNFSVKQKLINGTSRGVGGESDRFDRCVTEIAHYRRSHSARIIQRSRLIVLRSYPSF